MMMMMSLSAHSSSLTRCKLPLLARLCMLDHLLSLVGTFEFPAGNGGDALPLRCSSLSLSALLPGSRLQAEHPIGHFATRLAHHPDDASQCLEILDGEHRDGLAFAAGSPSTADAMDVRGRRLRKIVVDDRFYALEIDTACHEVGANQHPDFARPESLHGVVTLLLRAVSMDHIHKDAVIDELAEEFLSTLLGLHEDQCRRLHLALLHQLSKTVQLSVLVGDEEKLLLHIGVCRVHITYAHSKWTRQNGTRQVNHRLRKRRREHERLHQPSVVLGTV
mmetsp:Transcript_90556/g.173637  ORF Transcript_90556/g.173637 Transcript_90556/m.173637 type:complete len:277 (-) Transcript_90556:139-969(-)